LLHSLLLEHGYYLGAFLSALISHLVPFIPLPYLAVVWLLASTIPGLNPLLIGLSSGLGAGLGKASSYFIGRGGARLVGEERRRQLEVLGGLIKDYAALAAFIVSATPIPDDAFLIAVGMMRYPLWKYMVATLSGKVVLCVSAALLASSLTEALGWIMDAHGGWLSVAASVALMVAVAYVILRIDWSAVAEEVARSGWRGLMERAKREGLRTILLKRRQPP